MFILLAFREILKMASECVYALYSTYAVLFEWQRWWSQHQLRVSAVCLEIHCGLEIEQSEKAKYSLYRLCDSGLLPELNMAAAAFLQTAFIRKTSLNWTRLTTMYNHQAHLCGEGNEFSSLCLCAYDGCLYSSGSQFSSQFFLNPLNTLKNRGLLQRT